MDNDSTHDVPTSKDAVALTKGALLNLAVTFLTATIHPMGIWVMVLFIVILICELALISLAIREWVKYFRDYVDDAIRRQAMKSDAP